MTQKGLETFIMKKIKDYIHNHPKLKTTLKVLATIGVIFSVGFNILIIGVASCSNTHVEKTINEPTKLTKETKLAYDYNGSTFIGLSELVSYDYFARFIDNLKNFEFVYNTGVKVENFLLGQSVTINTNSDFWLVDLYADGDGVDSTSPITQINIDLDNDYDKATFFKFTFATQSYGPIELSGYYYFTDVTKTQFLYNTFMVRVNSGSDIHWDRTCLAFAINSYKSLLPQGTIASNYLTGYSEGYSVGEHDGYEEGYQDGITAYEGGQNSPFGLIRSAFQSVADILDIQILPNLSIGLILFAPVILAVIIVLFRMIRG